MPTLLFVCEGNVCRSPFAELLARSLVGGSEWQFRSAGLGALAGSAMDPLMAEQLTRRGGDPTGFVARQLTPSLAREADLVVTMQRTQRERVIEDFPARASVTLTLGQLARTLERLPSGEAGPDLAGAIRRHRAGVRPEEDIADPMGKGPEAARACARALDADVRRVVAGLAASRSRSGPA